MGSKKVKKVVNKLFLTGVVMALVSVDMVPAYSYAKDYQSQDEVGIEDASLRDTSSPMPLEESLDGTSAIEKDTGLVEEGLDEHSEEVTEQEPEEGLNKGNEDTTEIPIESAKEEDVELKEEPLKDLNLEDKDMDRPKLKALQTTNKYVLAKDTDFSGTKNGEFRYIGSDEYVEIPHTIKGVNVTSYYAMFKDGKVKGLKSTNKNVTNTSNMFWNYQGTSIDISELDTSFVKDMAYMFQATSITQSNLKTVVGMDKMDTSNVTTMSGMFYRSSISNINVSNFNTKKVTSMYRMFGDALTSEVDVSNLDTSTVVTMEEMFRYSRVKTLDLSNFNTQNVTNMANMFGYSHATTIKGLEKFNTEKVTNMYGMFQNTQVSTINIPNFNTTNVKNMEYMFAGSVAQELDLINFDTNNVTAMGYMFKDAKAKKINLSSFDTSNVATMNSMFMGSEAQELDLSSFNTANVKDMIYMFRSSQATKLDVSSFDTSKVEKMTSMFSHSKATTLDLKGFNTINVTDMGRMFTNSEASVLDLHTFNTKRLTDMSEMFMGTKATSINVSSFDTTYVINMNSMFKDVNVKELDLGSFNMESVNDTDNMFQNTKALKGIARSSVDLDKLDSSLNKPSTLKFTAKYKLAKDEDFSGFYNGNFRYIGKDEYIEVPHKIKGTNITSYQSLFENTTLKGVISTNNKVTDMSNMFKGNTSQTLDTGNIDTSSVTNMSGMFQNTKMSTLDLEGFNTVNVTDMSKMFENTMLKEIDLGSFDLTKVTNTGYMFKGTSALIGYVRTNDELTKLSKSTNKPTTLSFTIWGIRTEQSTDSWTNQPVEVAINAESTKNGIRYVEMVNETGRNYVIGSKYLKIFQSNNGETYPFSRGYDSNVEANYIYGIHKQTNTYALSLYAETTYEGGRGTVFSEDLYPIPEKMTQSLSVMSEEPIRLGFRGGKQVTLKPNEWTRITSPSSTYAGRPDGIDVPTQPNIPIGTRIYYKDYKIEKGDTATPWKPAPEDSESSSGQKDAFKIYTNGTYIFRATDTLGNTKTVSHKVTNIDTTQPTATITHSPEGWTSTDVKIYVNAEDDLSGVSTITLPNGQKVSGDTAEYPVTDNGTYEFKVTDKAGNSTTVKKEITNIDKSIPELKAKTLNKQWTSGTVDIEVTSGETASGLTDIIMKSSPLEGRNLLLNTGEIKQGRFSGWQHYFEDVNLSSLGVDKFKQGGRFKLQGYVENIEGNEEVGLMLHLWKDNNFHYRQFAEGGTNQVYIKPNKSGNVYLDINMPKEELVSGHMALRHRSGSATSSLANMSKVKLEVGDTITPYTIAPEDVKLQNNKKVYTIATNGMYTFQSTYNNGMKSEASVNVSNIDRDAPKVTVTGNTEDWTEEDKLILTIKATDTQSGVKKITLPSNTVVNGTTATYEVTKNGKYTFTVEDNVGNKTTHTEEVKYLMIDYNFYIYDKQSKPVKGAEFELLRNGESYKKALSTATGLVDFGKVPPEGKYSVRQITAPDGVVVEPGDIESGDFTEPVEFVKYPRGDTLPATGTVDLFIYVGIAGSILGVNAYIKKRRGKQISQ